MEHYYYKTADVSFDRETTTIVKFVMNIQVQVNFIMETIFLINIFFNIYKLPQGTQKQSICPFL